MTETALTIAPNMSSFAERVALFGIAMGARSLLAGIGFIVLTPARALGASGLPRRKGTLGTASAATSQHRGTRRRGASRPPRRRFRLS